jgi:lipid A 3-O-deacylase
MSAKNVLSEASVFGCVLMAVAAHAHAVDSASLEYGTGDETKMVRVGAQWKWNKQWWQSNGTHVGGYWDLTLAHWRGSRFQNIPGNTQYLTAVGITPVFRFQNDRQKGFYVEAGLGAYLLSDLYDNNGKQLSTHYQFGDHLGVGYVFSNNLDLNLRVQHFSNAGIKEPNSGVNFAIIRISSLF